MRNLLLFLLSLWSFVSYANNECTNAIQLTPGTSCSYTTGTFSGATITGAGPSCSSGASQDVWYKFTATDVTMSVGLNATSNLNHGFEIYQGGCSGTPVACANARPEGWGEYYFNNNFIVGQEYHVRVFNAGTVTASNFQICVTKYPTPANDLCANAQQLTPGTTCNVTTASFSGTLKDGGTPACATSASQDLWYKFTATDVTMSVGINQTQDLNHGFEIYQGGCNGTLVACVNNYSEGWGEYYFNNNFVVGQEYYVRVFNASGTLQTRNFQICVTKYPTPANDLCANAQQLTPGTTCTVTTASFSGTLMNGAAPACAANASQDLWYKFTATDVTMSVGINPTQDLDHGFELYQGGCNGTLISCVNNNTSWQGEYYFNNNFIVGQEYYVRVFNVSSALQTRNFQICVTKYPTPANDLCANAQQLTPGTTCTLTYGSFSGTLMDDGIPACAANTSQDLWYKFTATDVTMSIELPQVSELNSGFELYRGGCNGTLINCVNENLAGSGEYYFSNNFIVGQEYYVRVFNASGTLQTRNFQICVTKYPTPANDLCANAQQLTPANACNYTFGTFSGSLMDGGTPACAASASQDVWYRFTATAATMSVTLNQVSNLNHGFEIYHGGCTGTILACVNANATGWGEGNTYSNYVIGEEYYIRVFNTSNTLQTRTFGICLQGPPPVACTPSVAITSTATTLCQGTSVTFTATPTNGGTNPSYQWKVGTANVGSNSPTYTTSTLGNGNVVSVVMVSAASCASQVPVTSNTITVNVNTPTTTAFTPIAPICPGQPFTLPTTSTNGVTGTWSPAVNNNTTTTYTFTPNAGQCATTATMTVTINSNITPTFTQVAPICSGGAFTLPTTSTNGVTGTWSPAINSNATTTYTFTPSAGQCASTATMTVTVNSNITPTFTQVTPICSGGTFTLPTTSNNGITGTWSPAINNTATTTYTFTPIAGQCAVTTTMTVMVNNAVSPTFTQIAAICQGGSFTLPATSNNGITGTWSPAINNTSTTTYTFTPTAGQCAVNTTMTVTVNNNVTPTFTQIAAICQGGSFTLPTTSTNGITGTWSPAINNTATTTYVFMPNAGQCAVFTTMTVTVTPGIVPTFTQLAPVCQGGSFNLPTTSTNGVTGTWSPAVNNNTTTTYTFTPNSGQCATTATMTVTVNSSVTPTFTQVAAICPGGSFTLPTTSINGVTGTWSPAVNNNTTTTYTFTPSSGQCATTATMTVTVSNSVIPTFTQVAAICPGGSFTLPTTSTNGVTGTWSPAVNNNTTTTYTFMPNSGQCATTATMTVFVNVVNAGVTTQGSTITASAAGATYQWINCANNQPIAGANGASFTATANGSYAVIVLQNGCSATSQCVAITNLSAEGFEKSGWKIYPNPATEQLYIDVDDDTDVKIIDLAGKTILRQSLKSGSNSIDVAGLSAGMYLIKSATGAHTKFVKK